MEPKFKIPFFFLQEAVNMFSIVDLKFDNKMSATEIYSITRGILMTVQHEDLILLYVLTRLHPNLPKHISDIFKPRIIRDNQIKKDEILREVDDFFVEVKAESSGDLPNKTEQMLVDNSKDQVRNLLEGTVHKFFFTEDWN